MDYRLILDDILSGIQKPARYIGQEWNMPKKDFQKAQIKLALCFPDLYEVGMSNLGLRIIYGILNNIPDVCCERFFSCASDMEKILRDKHLEIFSLESKRRLREFDIIGFSLGYELNYTNALDILDLGAIPLKSSLRDNAHPLVIAGGPCVLNPEPMHEFIDLFIIGESEEAILEIINMYRKLKNKFRAGKMTKQDLLVMFSSVEGTYAPSLYDVTYNAEGKIEKFKPKLEGVPLKIKKRFVKDLNTAYFPSDWLTPYMQIVYDRMTVEIMRGCPNECRFCQARQQYYPYRQRSIQNILNLVCNTYKCTGYEDISLGGLSVSDYSGIEELLGRLIDIFRIKGVSVSLPSVKPNVLMGSLSSLIATIKKTGLTFAPEAATEKLRKILNKDFDVSSFFMAIEQAYRSGYQRIKLYFMIGLPYEEEADIDAIVDFATRVSELRKKVVTPSLQDKRIKYGSAEVNISVNTLIPKPHTPFQWIKMQGIETIRYKQDYLKNKIRNRKLKLSFHNDYMSLLEGILCRGDRRLSRVILSAFNKGARFDAWGDSFKFDIWQEAFKETKIDPDFYLAQRSKEEILPWDFLDIGISKEKLIAGLDKLIDLE